MTSDPIPDPDSQGAHQPSPPIAVTTEPYRIVRSFYCHRTDRISNSLLPLAACASIDLQSVRTMLHMGYVPGTRTIFEHISCLPGGRQIIVGDGSYRIEAISEIPAEQLPSHNESLRKELTSRFLTAVDASFSRSREVILPLSGGLDSRLLLGAALKCTNAANIRTYTYGVPGSLDFDLGNRLAAQTGTRHAALDLRTMSWTEDRLRETAVLTDANNNLFHPYVWTEVIRRIGTDGAFWSGYTGDGLGGSFHQPDLGETPADAVERLVRTESRIQPWARHVDDFGRSRSLCERQTKYDRVLSPVEAVWFENHPERFTAHHIFVHGLQFEAPFMALPIVSFLLNLDDRYRDGKRFFNDWAATLFPHLFRVPTRSYGRRLDPRRWVRRLAPLGAGVGVVSRTGYRLLPSRFVHPQTSYLDFNQGLRRSGKLRSLVLQLIQDLAQRQIVSDKAIWTLWKRHQRGALMTSSLLLLASVEVALQAAAEARVTACKVRA